MNVRMILVVLIAGLVVVNLLIYIQARTNRPAVDLILVNGKIVTMDETRPVAEALAVVGNMITAVG